MKHNYFFISLLFVVLTTTLSSCGSDDSDTYIEIPEESPVVLDLNAVPYTTLSEYNFFEGELKNLQPVYKVIPYDLNSSLFTDYAEKKRFIWMPKGTKATYTADGKIPIFPVGTVLIKNFYYDGVAPDNTTRIIETRIMIKKAEGWIFVNYVWNDEQTEAVLNTQSITTTINRYQNGAVTTTNYKIPSTEDCTLCHTINETYTPIGVKPQNLNKSFNYTDGLKNQLDKWIEEGFLDTKPQNIVSSVDWTDESYPLEIRVRSYLDINCAHCHSAGASCDYTPMELSFSQSALPANLGVCIEPVDFASGGQEYIVSGQDVRSSLMHFRIKETSAAEMMPPLGRTVTHREGLQLITDWIENMETICP
ncbi:hypothetical protein E0W68_09145 [Flavobacterium salilacus subsp. salilacus]|uniref:hypothetical protein n=1 Tax=Flavobacterium TaxID=237 RepID=UPI001074C726|nr:MULTISPECIES: hypothetical protein [Flavobacterium]KAF2518481.1 hypothetical protein E0W68_09145 [Flavobacterium salilacus subsp. salilacus]MBE1615120.1 hypothetical protein [Flavobacterium sp. SaA2.13]